MQTSLLILLLLFLRLLTHVQLFVTLWIAVRQALLCFIISWSLLGFMPIESVMLSDHLILCRPLLLLYVRFVEANDVNELMTEGADNGKR